MTASPGHQKWPDHKVQEKHPKMHLQVFYKDRKIADSSDVIKVVEDDHPDRFYIPREDINMKLLERTEKTTKCPFKGTAHYYSIKDGSQEARDAVWTYEEPFDEHKDLKDRLAFYEEKLEELRFEAQE